jgi:hypothetical protein
MRELKHEHIRSGLKKGATTKQEKKQYNLACVRTEP